MTSTTIVSLRKIGGMYWLKLGRVRVAFCITKPRPADPIVLAAWQARQIDRDKVATLLRRVK